MSPPPRTPPPGPTIVAIATGPAAGGIGIVRLSGSCALEAARGLAPSLPVSPLPRHAYLTTFVDGAGAVLDEGLTLHFPGPRSFTGEDVVELHAHGAPRLLRLLTEQLLAHPGVRLAEPGEFTRRAFLNGRIDLSRAEAVADLVAAESEAAVRASAAQLSGQLSRRIVELRAPLIELAADLEGVLDFPDETGGAGEDFRERLALAATSVRSLFEDSERGPLLRRRARVVLYGPVNAGKSTLFNRLSGADRALVDPEPGTTRDALEAMIELGGLALALIDTAGLRADAGRLEALGIARTRDALAGADLAVLVIPPAAAPDEVERWQGEAEPRIRLDVLGKADLPRSTWNGADSVIRVSGQTGEGLDDLRRAVLERLGARAAQAAVVSSERHLDALRRAADGLERAGVALAVSTLEVVAGEVGLALAALGEITGEDLSVGVLDAIFRRFCIGK